jgi:hypothetical protein
MVKMNRKQEQKRNSHYNLNPLSALIKRTDFWREREIENSFVNFQQPII